MSNHPEHGKISFTSKLVAYYRMFSDIPFAKDVAEYIGAEQAHDSLFKHQEQERGELMEYAPILEARYKSIVNLISELGIRQVLELASGFSLRVFAWATRSASLWIANAPANKQCELDLFCIACKFHRTS